MITRAVYFPLLSFLLGAAVAAPLGYIGARRAIERRRALPRVVSGISAPVEIVRDRWWTPHVRAASIADALFGLGFVHAQDRLFQMDLARRAAAGRLSEVIGPPTVEIDRYYRTLGLQAVAEAEWNRTPPEWRRYLEAYAAGVNAARAMLPPPIETFLLRYRIEPWQPVDSLALTRLLSTSLTMNWESELARWQLAMRYSGRKVWANEQPERRPEESLFVPALGLSNAWAVSGARSVTGHPLLSGDPHLRASLPPSLHLSHVQGGDLDVIGASMPGVPGILLGHNQRIAWSVTAALTDCQDLFIEEFDLDGRYRRGREWRQAEVRVERIRVRGAPEVVVRALSTDRGPIISTVLDGDLPPLALSSSVLVSEPNTMPALLGLNLARDWESFRAALRWWTYPPLNFIYADVDGHIGYQLAGFHPRRGEGSGVLPLHAADSPGWEGWVSFDELPSQFDPPEGQVVSANQPPGPGYPFLGFDMFDSSRYERIVALLAETERHSIDSFRRLLADWYSAPLHRFAEALLAARPRRALEAHALALLREWDGQLLPESAAAAVAQVALRRLIDEHADAEFGELAPLWLGFGPHVAAPFNSYSYRNRTIILGMVEQWRKEASWPERASRVLAAAVEELEATLGGPERWAWGRLHVLHVRHPLGVMPGVARLLNRGPFPLGGDQSTVFQSALAPSDRYGASAATPAVRQIFDLADWDRSRAVLPGGQSGAPFSPYYADQLDDWLAVRDHPLPFTRAAVDKEAVARLRLTPSNAPTTR
ncbi:MAG: penicillin acylase family protein [Chloroflexota bacterium]|nr:penicillin acylase family protein [Dehalococcoidia bacterium]MDW8253102.1 penicillin acylase family protein [Chloroflexota bacterium]